MTKINIFICTADEDVKIADIFRETFSDCYGLKVFLYKHSNVGSQDYYQKIITGLNNCEIFVPLLSKNLVNSHFSNQEIGYAVNKKVKQEIIIFPISLDGQKSFDLIDHIQPTDCKPKEEYGVLKTATYFFRLIICHKDFVKFKERAISGLIYVLNSCRGWKSISSIVFLLESTVNDLNLSRKQIKQIVSAAKSNAEIKKLDQLYDRLKQFLNDRYKISID